MSDQPKMDFHGAQQTCYADWSRCVLSYYPYNPKYQRNGDSIEVYYDSQKVAEFEFDTGRGYIVPAPAHTPEEVGKLPNYTNFDIDNLLLVE